MRSVCAWSALLAAGAHAGGLGIFELTPPLIPLVQNAGSPALFPVGDCFGFALEEATIDDMQKAMQNGSLTSVSLVTCYMRRTFQTQQYINSVLQMNPDALAIASQLDAERSAGKVRGPLHGIPFTVKDNIGTKDNLETTAGSWALLGSRVPRDAHVVAKLRDAGAVLFGKATLSEWADMRSNNYSEGYSGRGGQCRSAYNLTVNPGGSSSGSGVGVGANTIAFSMGTETDGSVINPAMRNSIVGFKPTVGLTSRGGVIPESEHQDSVGTFGRTVRDAVYALDAIYGVDSNDNYTLAQKGKTPNNGYVPFLSSKDALKNATFGIPWNSFWVYANAEQQKGLGELVKLIQSAGATVINGTEITNYQTIVSPQGWNWDYGTSRGFPNESEYTYVKVDFYNNINKYLSQLTNTKIRTINDIVQYNNDNAGTEGGFPFPNGNPAFASGQDGFLASLATKGIQDQTYFQALEFCQSSTRNGIDDALSYKGKKLNGLLVPVDPGQSYQIAAQAGYPLVTIPAGVYSDSGMGFGLGIMQTAWAEAELVRWASAIEDLQRTSSTPYKRTLPTWRGYLQRNLPVPL
ncbi:putative amidase [Tolypocladium ophioglossoides CBS 100239]|uniref:Putative amidase n=1 Tax=Tolypocladium ophioglossoides (strain CBS 100239) TaxID=1163406 RepID=A0A0L0MWK7_TOLOC|nr:putative amidase [Tolypocladium ophioglossoides CBS 100239]